MEETVCTVADCFVAIYASRTYNADRRLRNFHHSTLYGRGMCPQHYIGMCLNKKGILHVTSRMVFCEIQSGKDMPIVFYLRTFSYAKA